MAMGYLRQVKELNLVKNKNNKIQIERNRDKLERNDRIFGKLQFAFAGDIKDIV